jgi:DNA-binding LacI/PurR family transcriptional regulator
MLAGMADSAGRSDRGRGRLPTIVEVASRAGVSIATVSRVVSGTGRVREPTRARVEQAIAATGWTADPAARVLAGGTGDEVILAIAVAGQQRFADDPHYARVIAGACQEAARHGLFDDSPPAVMTTPALTTVYQPVEDLAKLAVRTLMNPTSERLLDQRLPTHLVVRASSPA